MLKNPYNADTLELDYISDLPLRYFEFFNDLSLLVAEKRQPQGHLTHSCGASEADYFIALQYSVERISNGKGAEENGPVGAL